MKDPVYYSLSDPEPVDDNCETEVPRELDALGPNASDLPLNERRASDDQSERNGKPQLNFSLSLESDLPEDDGQDGQDEMENVREGVGAEGAARQLQRVRVRKTGVI